MKRRKQRTLTTSDKRRLVESIRLLHMRLNDLEENLGAIQRIVIEGQKPIPANVFESELAEEILV